MSKSNADLSDPKPVNGIKRRGREMKLVNNGKSPRVDKPTADPLQVIDPWKVAIRQQTTAPRSSEKAADSKSTVSHDPSESPTLNADAPPPLPPLPSSSSNAHATHSDEVDAHHEAVARPSSATSLPPASANLGVAQEMTEWLEHVEAAGRQQSPHPVQQQYTQQWPDDPWQQSTQRSPDDLWEQRVQQHQHQQQRQQHEQQQPTIPTQRQRQQHEQQQQHEQRRQQEEQQHEQRQQQEEQQRQQQEEQQRQQQEEQQRQRQQHEQQQQPTVPSQRQQVQLHYPQQSPADPWQQQQVQHHYQYYEQLQPTVPSQRQVQQWYPQQSPADLWQHQQQPTVPSQQQQVQQYYPQQSPADLWHQQLQPTVPSQLQQVQPPVNPWQHPQQQVQPPPLIVPSQQQRQVGFDQFKFGFTAPVPVQSADGRQILPLRQRAPCPPVQPEPVADPATGTRPLVRPTPVAGPSTSTPRIPAALKGKDRERVQEKAPQLQEAPVDIMNVDEPVISQHHQHHHRSGTSVPPQPTGKTHQTGPPQGDLMLVLLQKFNMTMQTLVDESRLRHQEHEQVMNVLTELVQHSRAQPPVGRTNDTTERRKARLVAKARDVPKEPHIASTSQQPDLNSADEQHASIHRQIFEGHPDLNRMRETIRAFLRKLLKSNNAKQLRRKHPPLTPEQVQAFEEGEDGAITLNPENYRVDFEHNWKGFLFNEQSRVVFIESYLAAVAGGMFSYPPIAPILFNPKQVGSLLDAHIPYLRRIYRKAEKKPNAHQVERARMNSRMAARRATLYESRVVCTLRRKWESHTNLLCALGPVYMSGDETDPGHTTRQRRVNAQKDHAASYLIIDNDWASPEFTAFVRGLDDLYRDDWADPNGRPGMLKMNKSFLIAKGLTHRATRTKGNPPRTRLVSGDRVKKAQAPVGLPRNCYCPTWLAKMQEWRRNMLDIQDTDHDFTIPTDTSVVLPSGPEDDLMAGDLDVAEEADYMGEDEEEEEEEEL